MNKINNDYEAVQGAVTTDDANFPHAYLYGKDHPDLAAVLKRPFTMMTGTLYGQGDHRNTKDGKWKRVELPLIEWIKGDKKTWGLAVHPESKSKYGSALVFGEAAEGSRTDKAIIAQHAVVLDVDSGAVLEDIIVKIEQLGLFAIVYTSYNCGKTELVLQREQVMKALNLDASPNLAQVQDYLRQHHKDNFETDFIDACAIVEERHTSNGLEIVLRTPPLDKFRVVFPLDKPVVLSDLAPTLQQWKEVWADAVCGMAVNHLECDFDATSCDINRLHFAPRHAKGDNNWMSAIILGKPLKFEDIKPHSKAKFLAERKNGDNPFLVGSGDDRQEVGLFETPLGVSLNDWHGTHKTRFMLSDVLETYCSDKERNAGGERAGTMHVECPFEHEHSSTGGTATLAMNPDVTDHGYWTIFCQHDSCKGRHKLEFIQEMLEQQWFEEALLTDETFCLPPEHGDDDQPAGTDAGLFEDPADWMSDTYKIKGNAIYKKGGEDEPDLAICQRIDVVGRSSNADGTAGAGVIVSFVNENGKTVEITVSRADIVADGSAVLTELADAGLLIFGRGPKAKDRLLDLLHTSTPKRRIPTINTPGFVRDEHGDIEGFLYPTGDYDRVSDETAPMRLLEGSRVEVTKTKGTLEGWTTAAVEALSYADSNFYWPLGLVSGFAGPLLGILEWLPCGFSLSGQTSKGKTLSQIMGTTIWTTPAAGKGVLFTANTTGNAMEDLATRGTDTLLAMDELGAMSDKKALNGILFALSTGRTKSRKSGRERGLTQGDSFRPFTLISSEKGMRNEIKAAGDTYRGGLAVRFPDIDVSDGVTVADASLIKLDAFQKNYGHAGGVYINYLITSGVVANPANLEKEVLAIASNLAQGQGPAMTRAAKVFAVVQRGGELAAGAGLLGDVSEARNAIKTTVQKAWDTFTASDEAGAATGGDAVLDRLRSFLFGELNRRIILMDGSDDISDGHANARGDVLGWADADFIYLDSAKVQDPAVLNLDIGSRNEMTTQLGNLGVLVKPEGKGATFRQLPKELSHGSENGAAVRNIRLCRKKLGV